MKSGVKFSYTKLASQPFLKYASYLNPYLAIMAATNPCHRRHGTQWFKPSLKEKNNPMLLFENMGSLVIVSIIAGIFMSLLFCISITILALLIRNQVKNMNMRLETLMSAMQIEEESRSEKRKTSREDKKGLQLDDSDIQKLKNIGVGMD